MKYKRKPSWLKTNTLGALRSSEIRRKLRERNLHTVCESAKCPNLGECFENGTATFMILGDTCTRNCRFCAINNNIEDLVPVDSEEPIKIAELSKDLGLKHIVITTVTRDDLEDGGASQFVHVINKIRKICNEEVTVEVLISDLQGNVNALNKIIDASPDVLNHNVETIQRLYPEVRPMANFARSLNILKNANIRNKNIITKSGFMVGLGEEKKEVLSLMEQLRKANVDVITIGQYIAPSKKHYEVVEYVHPEIFKYYTTKGRSMGFKLVESGPLVRSSYHAEKARKIINFR